MKARKTRRRIRAAIVLAGLLTASATGVLAQPAFHVFLEVKDAPEVGDYALKTSALITEWYPRINVIVHGANAPLPYDTVAVTFLPGLPYPAAAQGNLIRVNSDYIKTMPDDFRAMLIHELTHVVQHYPHGQADAGWLVEGIADYIRHKYFEKDIQPTLRLDAQGVLYGYAATEPFFHGLQENHTSLADKGYLKSYVVAAAFLFWLESHKDKQVVTDLNKALSAGTYTPALFQTLCGDSLDNLWAAFIRDSERH